METVEIYLYRSCRRSCLNLCGGTQQTERDSALARHLVSCHARQTPKSTELTVASKKWQACGCKSRHKFINGLRKPGVSTPWMNQAGASG